MMCESRIGVFRCGASKHPVRTAKAAGERIVEQDVLLLDVRRAVVEHCQHLRDISLRFDLGRLTCGKQFPEQWRGLAAQMGRRIELQYPPLMILVPERAVSGDPPFDL